MGPQHLIAKSADSMGEQVLGRGLMARGFLRKSNLFAIPVAPKVHIFLLPRPEDTDFRLPGHCRHCGLLDIFAS